MDETKTEKQEERMVQIPEKELAVLVMMSKLEAVTSSMRQLGLLGIIIEGKEGIEQIAEEAISTLCPHAYYEIKKDPDKFNAIARDHIKAKTKETAEEIINRAQGN